MEIKGKDVVRQVSMLAGHIADMRGASYEDYERTVSALWDDPPLAAFLLRQSVGDFARGVSAVTAYAVEGLEAVDEESEDLGREALENCRLRFEIDAGGLGVTVARAERECLWRRGRDAGPRDSRAARTKRTACVASTAQAALTTVLS